MEVKTTFEYIEENLETIKNTDNVLCIIPVKKGQYVHLDACLTNGEVVQMTKEKHYWLYRQDAMNVLKKELGDEFMNNFYTVFENQACINKKHIKDMSCDKESMEKIDVTAKFCNGQEIVIGHCSGHWARREIQNVKFNIKMNNLKENKNYQA